MGTGLRAWSMDLSARSWAAREAMRERRAFSAISSARVVVPPPPPEFWLEEREGEEGEAWERRERDFRSRLEVEVVTGDWWPS